MSEKMVRLGLIQHVCTDDRQANVAKAEAMIRDAARQGAQIVATQELFAGPYFPQTEDPAHFDQAEPIPGPTSQRLCDLARELGITLTASLFEKRAEGLYHNTSIMIDAGAGIVGTYRKMHIPDDPGFYEKFYFTPGDATPWRVQRTRHAATGMLICWDQWFPEAARLTALAGAQILFYPTAIAWSADEPREEQLRQREAWVTMQRSHAIANGVFVAATNRVGVEGALTFWGGSFVADPGGRIIAQADESSEQVLLADCDLSRVDAVRRMWPFLRDRRVDAYQPMTERYLDP